MSTPKKPSEVSAPQRASPPGMKPARSRGQSVAAAHSTVLVAAHIRLGRNGEPRRRRFRRMTEENGSEETRGVAARTIGTPESGDLYGYVRGHAKKNPEANTTARPNAVALQRL